MIRYEFNKCNWLRGILGKQILDVIQRQTSMSKMVVFYF